MNPIDLTRRLIALKTMNPPGQERDCAKFLGGLLEKAGFKTRYLEFAEARTCLIAWTDVHDWTNRQGERRPVCFTGHLDTVPLGVMPWSRDPFGGSIEGDKLYGIGTSDMKGGVAAMVTAALRAAQVSHGKTNIMLILTAGEEAGCQGARFLAQSTQRLPPAGALVVGEPTLNYPCIAHKGVIWLDAQADGVAAHGSVPDKGVNAIYKAARAILRLQALFFPTPNNPILGAPTLNIGTITGGNAINIVPECAMFSVDIRTIPGQSHEAIYRQIEDCLGDDARISNRRLDCPPVETDANHPWIQDVFGIMEPILKVRPAPRGINYFTDASALASALDNPPVIILGPGDLARIHKTDEYCLVSNIEAAAEAYYQIMMKWNQH
ncbi:MAG: M20 family metallopeptidase [Verrucomicrobia bacterium]|nr:M20 family metallopeptidase [Verrucomicrobiota bacterium]MBU1735491.1 M20 family metallopeptidase [Verrucomicrobiota bacterium]MBU1856886.1 M20 family metallopeptidase [Verrucomicrobiota bacterium]